MHNLVKRWKRVHVAAEGMSTAREVNARRDLLVTVACPDRGQVPGEEQKERERRVGRRKDKRAIRADYVTPTVLIVVFDLDQSAFCYPQSDLYEADAPWPPPHPSLLSTPALRMFFRSLALSLVLTWASLRSAHAMPTSKVVVELSACGMTPETSSVLLPQQVSILQNPLLKLL